ncbi:hypothetical protein RJ640_026824 [Escallonia rubra]|uniref:Polymerase nucleotidyl transferase domain-containing protein n=1 Tax=Escallonia rubra TaxID=112253 RepID=A0AA88RPE2_9ASTE|nr:hypothetical protein RJ640_026824 [Escallonia rubra]
MLVFHLISLVLFILGLVISNDIFFSPVLLTKVKKFELKGLREHKVIPERTAALEELLQDFYFNSCPKQSDYRHRRDLVQVFNEIAKELYGKSKDCPIVEVFGSFVMDIFSSTSDLDLSVNFNSDAAKFPKEKKIRALWKFAKKLNALQSNGHVYGVQPIMSARVPIVKVVDSGTGIECDISVENRDGILKSHIVHMISSIDGRFQKLSFLMKAWAKVHDINSSKDHTLNSLSIILLVAFHLQQNSLLSSPQPQPRPPTPCPTSPTPLVAEALQSIYRPAMLSPVTTIVKRYRSGLKMPDLWCLWAWWHGDGGYSIGTVVVNDGIGCYGDGGQEMGPWRFLHECTAYQRSVDLSLNIIVSRNADLDHHLVKSDSDLVLSNVESTSDLADRVSLKVYELDLAQWRVSHTLLHIDAIVERTACIDGVKKVLASKDFESAATFTRDPPILPPFSVIFEDGTDPSKVKKLVKKFSNYGEKNKESLAELFVTLLIKLSSVEKLWPKGLCASTYQGSWISKTWNSTVGCISVISALFSNLLILTTFEFECTKSMLLANIEQVEDFTDRSQNVARAVGRAQVEIIYTCIQLTIQNIFAFIDGRIQGPTLREFLFGRVTMPGNAGIANFEPPIFLHPIQALRMPLANNMGAAPPPVPFDPFQAKRRRTTEAWMGMPTENWRGTRQVMPIDHVFALTAEGWGGGTHGWGGMPTAEGWAQTQQPTGVDHNHKRKMHTSAGWGSMQHAVPTYPMQADEARSAEGNLVVSAGLDNARGPLQPNFFSYHGSSAFDASRSGQPMSLMVSDSSSVDSRKWYRDSGADLPFILSVTTSKAPRLSPATTNLVDLSLGSVSSPARSSSSASGSSRDSQGSHKRLRQEEDLLPDALLKKVNLSSDCQVP